MEQERRIRKASNGHQWFVEVLSADKERSEWKIEKIYYCENDANEYTKNRTV